jgi:uncharacterized membrane protein (Fun14 family)
MARKKSSGDLVGLAIGAIAGLLIGWILKILITIIDALIVLIAVLYGGYWGWKHLKFRRGKLIRK